MWPKLSPQTLTDDPYNHPIPEFLLNEIRCRAFPTAMAALRGGGGLDTTGAITHKYQSQIPSNGYRNQASVAVSVSVPVSSSSSSSSCLKHTIPWRGRGKGRAAAVGMRAEEAKTAEGGGISYEVLRQRLASGQWQLADEETRRLIIVLAGESAVKRKYVFFSEVRFIEASELKTIDELWRRHSNGRFGYSVQRRIWNKVDRDFTEFFKKVGWMKRLDTEMEQYIYRSFPSEFEWELADSTPEGHLPLTNALRGTQLLASILQHPAFAEDDQEAEEDTQVDDRAASGSVRIKSYTPNYKF
uniref:TSA: Wollemia nobilis Ref_Wollemi_Transcript_1704_1071 transcribed RNA sequence n=1 Tax=Wollemia nobilis TaxID=56998 RepID=A0A0C9S980_9CONI